VAVDGGAGHREAACLAFDALRIGRSIDGRKIDRVAPHGSITFARMMKRKHALAPQQIHAFVENMVGDDLHAKRVLSLGNAAVGVVHAATLGVHAIGRAMAQAEGLDPKHAVKQVDRLLSNAGVDVWLIFGLWVPYVVGARQEIVVALDWTEFDRDDHATLALHLITRHGRATPLIWLTVRKSELAGERNAAEDRLLRRFRQIVPREVRVTILADRGFGDAGLYALLWEMGFDYLIRFRGSIYVADSDGARRPAKEWVPPSGRACRILNAEVTTARTAVPAVVCVQAKGMKEAWCLATSRTDLRATEVVKYYGKRFTIEETFRDTKDIHFGMGLSATHIGDPARRDRLLLLSAIATTLITLLGAAGEAIGLDRRLKANTSKERTHSLFFQGTYYYGALPNMKADQFEPLVTKFGELLRQQNVFTEIFGLI
jgi:DDE family transposase